MATHRPREKSAHALANLNGRSASERRQTAVAARRHSPRAHDDGKRKVDGDREMSAFARRQKMPRAEGGPGDEVQVAGWWP